MRGFIKRLGYMLLTLLMLLAATYSFLAWTRVNDLRQQREHLDRLQARYESGSRAPDERTLVDFDPEDESIKLNTLRFLATHNSYKKTGPALGRIWVGLVAGWDEARALAYGYRRLGEQLEAGIRSLELDVRLRRGRFELSHVPMVDHASVAPDLELALEELRLFSVHHPDHLPILILMEIKSDWMRLDLALQPIGTAELRALDQLIERKLSDRLHRPRDLMAHFQAAETSTEDGNLRAMIQSRGWPTLASLRGKFIFVLHAGESTAPYAALDPTLQTQAMFPSVTAAGTDRDYAAFVIHNSPDPVVIRDLVEAGFMVRTRIDARLVFDDARLEAAWHSGAQILSSDFTVGRSDLPAAARITLPGGRLTARSQDPGRVDPE